MEDKTTEPDRKFIGWELFNNLQGTNATEVQILEYSDSCKGKSQDESDVILRAFISKYKNA